MNRKRTRFSNCRSHYTPVDALVCRPGGLRDRTSESDSSAYYFPSACVCGVIRFFFYPFVSRTDDFAFGSADDVACRRCGRRLPLLHREGHSRVSIPRVRLGLIKTRHGTSAIYFITRDRARACLTTVRQLLSFDPAVANAYV